MSPTKLRESVTKNTCPLAGYKSITTRFQQSSVLSCCRVYRVFLKLAASHKAMPAQTQRNKKTQATIKCKRKPTLVHQSPFPLTTSFSVRHLNPI
ncbi:hypothetical protein Mapa_011431 [Marchantia paleacea]|nr:hypothetical protein Mapa_011431 [Marchantia paleacea]